AYTAQCTSSDGGAPGSQSSATSTVTVGGLTNGKTYTCTAYVTNAAGNSNTSSASSSVIPRTVPNTPAAPVVAGGNQQVVITVTPPFNGGSAITGYTAQCTSSNGGAPGSATNATSPITVGSLTNGKTYTCSVYATNVAGNSGVSNASAVVTPGTTPSSPTSAVAHPLATTTATGSLLVTFVGSVGNGSPVTGYTASCTSTNGGTAGSH